MSGESAAAERLGAKLRAGTVLADRYCIESILGAGGFGVVWKARHVHLETECAIKVFDPPPGADAQDSGARFLQEARLMARLKCPHVAQVFDYGVHERMPFLVLELLQGNSLARHLQLLRARETRMSPADTARIVRHVAEALQLAHAARVVHRDLKPDNIFLVQEGESTLAKVLDFGIAKWSADTAPTMTSTHTVMGTAHYMSPEQFESARNVDHRADLWSLGVIAFECLTGQIPFPGDSFIEVAFKVCKEGPLVASQLAPVPPGFDAWFARATTIGREHRFDSALEQAEALERVCAEPVLELAPEIAEPTSEAAGAVSKAPSEVASDGPPAMAATLPLGALAAAQRVAATPRRRRWSAWVVAGLFGAFAGWRLLFAGSSGSAARPDRDPSESVRAARPASREASAAAAPSAVVEAPAVAAPAAQAPAAEAAAVEPAGAQPPAVAVVPSVAAAASSAGSAESAAAAARPSSPPPSASRAPKSALAKTQLPAPAAPRDSAKSEVARSEAAKNEAARSDGTPGAGTAGTGTPGAGTPGTGESSASGARESDGEERFSAEVAPSSNGGAGAVPGPDIANTTFDREAAKAALDVAAAQARNCRPPGGLTGTGRVQVIFEPSGKVTSVTLLTSRFEDTETGSCVRMVFRRARVPAFQGAPGIVVNKSFEIPEPREFRIEPLRRRL